MFGIGFFELVIIAIVALIFVGPKKLPEFMKTAGKFFVQMRRTATDVRSTFEQVVRDAEDEIRREEAQELHKALLASLPAHPNQESPPPASDPSHTPHHPDGSLNPHATDPLPESHQHHNTQGLTPEGVKAYDPHHSVTDAQWTDKTTPKDHDK